MTKKERRDQPDNAVALPRDMIDGLLALENEKNALLSQAEDLHGKALAIEHRQNAQLDGYLRGAGHGPFNPAEWSLDNIGATGKMLRQTKPALRAVEG